MSSFSLLTEFIKSSNASPFCGNAFLFGILASSVLSYTHALKGFVAVLTVPNESSNSSSLNTIPTFLFVSSCSFAKSNLNPLFDASVDVINPLNFGFVVPGL